MHVFFRILKNIDMNSLCSELEASSNKFKTSKEDIQENFQVRRIKLVMDEQSNIPKEVPARFCSLTYQIENKTYKKFSIIPSRHPEEIIILLKKFKKDTWVFNSIWRIKNLTVNYLLSGK